MSNILLENRHRKTCKACGASGYGNMTCRDCVREWPRFGIDAELVAELLTYIGDRPPEAPVGTRFH